VEIEVVVAASDTGPGSLAPRPKPGPVFYFLTIVGCAMAFSILLWRFPPLWLRDTAVPRAVYDRLEIGKPACLTVHTGLLGVQWFDVEACGITKPNTGAVEPSALARSARMAI
jgi:hypothetical protein